MAKIDFLKKRAEKDPNKLFRKLKGQVIQKFLVKSNADQIFHLVTNKTDLEFGANDLGVWVEEYKIRKSKKSISKLV